MLIHRQATNSNVLADHLWIKFDPGESYCTSPTDWLQSDVNRVNTIIQDIDALTRRSGIQGANFNGTIIYQVCPII